MEVGRGGFHSIRIALLPRFISAEIPTRCSVRIHFWIARLGELGSVCLEDRAGKKRKKEKDF